jgi:hypothetical protein
MVKFASLDREFWRQMELARKVVEENREVLRKLAAQWRPAMPCAHSRLQLDVGQQNYA